jgi:bifunctional non-homologous end joining protein LigD
MYYCLVQDLPSLVWVAQLGTIELHTSLSLYQKLSQPRMLVFDLDPGPPATIVECCEVAIMLRELLEQDGLTPLPKTSGSKGMQVSAPVQCDDPELTSRYAHAIAKRLEAARPDLIVSRMAKDLRPNKIFVDWSQNNPAKTTVAPYSLRAKSTPTVSTPLTWDEVASGEHLSFTTDEVLDRVEQHGDLFAPALDDALRVRLTPGMTTDE